MTDLSVMLPWVGPPSFDRGAVDEIVELVKGALGDAPLPRFIGRRCSTDSARVSTPRKPHEDSSPESTIFIESHQVGTVEIPRGSIITLPDGLPGFRDARRFCLLKVKPTSRFHLFQSLERADLAFVVIDPIEVDPAYPVDAVRGQALRFGIEADESMALAVIVSVPPAPAKMTVNLMAPLALGERSMRGFQVVLHRSGYRVRHVL